MLLTAATLWLLAGGSAAADVYDDNPATASRSAGETYVFARALDGNVLERHRQTTGWSDWRSIGGDATSGPAAAAYGGTIHVFVRGPDGAVYQSWLQDDGSFHSWNSLGGYTLSAPAVTPRRGTPYLDLVVRGGDSQMYQQSYVPGTGWSGFAAIGGVLTSGAAINSQSAGLLNIWSRATDGTMVQKSWNGSAWVDWSTLGGGLIGAPSTVSRAENVINIYVRGAADATYQRSWSAAGWTDWFLLDSTPVASTPVVGSDRPDREYLFARTAKNTMLYKEWNASTGWTGWSDLGPVAVPSPQPPPPVTPPAPPASDGELNVVTGLGCTPANGKLRVSIAVKKPKGKLKPRVSKIVFYTKGKGRKIRIDRKAPFVVRIGINRPAGSTGRVYARVYYRRSAHGKLHRKVVSRRYTVCR
ncbi:hypothetical protein OM076_30875 [Solirubrobacter ginsenosidimutans]|uniref:PLL-like beta propeller domain-containing protein n=1 Tax=Solirubrobacter ginsenosidimutans TaxID=490573 RepID=A0A9X3MY62_9ACTN|nr:hypothetical protein [Solirubrobacter ginsenosidimutans]